jgi:hypothetical protein
MLLKVCRSAAGRACRGRRHSANLTRPIVERTCAALRVRIMNRDITGKDGFITRLTKALLGGGVA